MKKHVITGLLLSITPMSTGVFAQSSGQVLTNPTVNGGTLNGTDATGAVVASGGTTQALSNWLSSFIPAGGAAADLGPAYGPILGVWPFLYFAPSPAFTGTPSVTGSATAQLAFIRGGSTSTFVGVTGPNVGISSAENLPIVFANNNYQSRVYIDPTYGNVGIGTANPTAKLDVVSQSVVIEQPFTPTSSASACAAGTISWDSNYIYVCVAANTWKRSTLGGF